MATPPPSGHPPPPPDPAPENGAGPRYHTGPRIRDEALLRLQSLEREEARGATWRGWLISLLAVAAISIFVPYADCVMEAAWFSFNAFPMIPVVLLLILILGLNLSLRLFRSSLGLTSQDLTLIFCVTTVTYAIPATGFWAFWSTGVTAGVFHARPENRWADLILPHLTPGFFLHDPADPESAAPRPVEWFYTGLPPGVSVPWRAWAGPFARWIVVVVFMYGIWFSVAALLQRRWSDQERLPFPVAQVPMEMLAGWGPGGSRRRGFLSYRLMLWGFGLTLLLHSWNALSTYAPNIPQIPLENWNVHRKYLTEAPWSNIGTLHIIIYPSIIGLTYLLSLEVAFSLWFFFALQKLVNFIGAPVYGLRNLHDVYEAQGSGALIALVLLSFWAARSELGRSFLEAIGKRPREEDAPGELSPRWTWSLLITCALGAVGWLAWLGASPLYGAILVLLFIIVMTGFARLVAEAGVFAAQMANFPIHLCSMVATPAALGSKNLVLLTVWDRLFSADWYRIVPMPHIMNSLHLARSTGLRTRTALSGMALGVALMLGLSFFTFLGLAYTQGGVNRFGWFFNPYPRQEYARIAAKVSKVDSWKAKRQKARAEKKSIPAAEIPKEAKRDWEKIGWTGFGAVVFGGFALARRYLFWWPHPAGYVLWMAGTIERLWFSFFLGWLFKWTISKFGGMRIYTDSRRFFIGVVIGECVAAVIWALIAMATGTHLPYRIKMG